MEQALQNSGEELRRLTSSLPIAIAYVDSKLCYRFVNSAYEDWVQRSREEIIGRHISEIVGKEVYEIVRERAEAALAGETATFEDTLPYRENGLRDVFVTYSPYMGERGRVEGFVAFITDVTTRNRADEALRYSEEKYRTLFSLASDAFITALLPDGHIIDANAAATALLGYSRDELLGLSGREHIIAPEVLEETEREWQTQLEQHGSFLVETVWVRKDRSRVPVAVSGKTLLIQGQLHFHLIGRDITERERLKQELRWAREELEGRVERQMLRRNPYGLTFREFTLLHLVAAGRADKEIARELDISPLTVHKHVANILGKMDAVSRTEAGVRAIREGLID